MRLYIGIDWSENKHDVVYMNEAGAVVARLTIAHSAQGFLQLEATREALGVAPTDCMVALETAHNLIIDFLWSRQYEQVYVIPPSVTKSNRGRLGSSGARSDQGDAFLLAEILRTDRGRQQPWHPDTLLTRQIRAKVSYIGHLTHNIVRTSNRLRAVLLRYYPATLHVFSSLRAQIRLAFICAYPNPQKANALTFSEFEAFAASHHYNRPAKLRAYFAALQDTHPQPAPETVRIYQHEAVHLATFLLNLVQAKNAGRRDLFLIY